MQKARTGNHARHPTGALPDFNVFVFSLPRCGSSMMTGVLEKLGVNMVYTSEDPAKRKKMEERYRKKLGNYVPNEHFYEIVSDQPQCRQVKSIIVGPRTAVKRD